MSERGSGTRSILAFMISPRSREKIALAVFVALVIVSMSGLGLYLLMGHSWNVTASNIDDTFGSMKGYTAIIYSGTHDEKARLTTPPSEPSSAPPPHSTYSQTKTSSSSNGSKGSPQGASEQSLAGDKTQDTSQGSTDISVDNSSSSSNNTKQPLSLDTVEQNYLDKSAAVCKLDTFNQQKYFDGMILKEGQHRFGIFTVDQEASPESLEKQVNYFKQQKVDFIIAITAHRAPLVGVSGIDIVIATADDTGLVMGQSSGGTFYVDTPELGRVGAILISPSNVVSAKVIEPS